jgi:Lipase maturation factor
VNWFFDAEDARGYWLARLLLERGIGVICLIAFLNALNQFKPLLGEKGLLPVPLFVRQVRFWDAPSLFFFFPRDLAFSLGAWLGIVLSCLVISGISSRSSWLSVATWLAIYVLYLSFVNVGQTFYGFGWESILLETCFFAAFLGAANVVPQRIPIWLFRWLLFRVMFGAGLIKIRGDSCWHDLTCLQYYYETQPIPNPVSWYAHWGPVWLGKAGVAFNHFTELLVPFSFFLPQPFAAIGGIITIAFQLSIISTGNLSWLNWLTLVLAFSTFDAKFFGILKNPVTHMQPPGLLTFTVDAALAVLVAIMSIPVVVNMLSARQIMNTNFNSFHLVGTYGAFGSITRLRQEVVLEGTSDAVITSSTRWREYEFKGKPGDVAGRPIQVAPYHLRLDWLMWFAAMSEYRDYPWFVNLVAKLLQNDPAVLSLLRSNPFAAGQPPRYVRARLYEYRFTNPEERKKTGQWWKRTLAGPYFPAVSLETPGFRQILESQGWLARQ